MNSPLSLAVERLVELPGATAGAAAATLVEVAGAQGYTVAATAPGTYRLARTRRRMLVSKRTESVVVSIFADRTGTKARIVGPLDDLVVEHLVATARPAPRQFESPSAPAPPAAPTPPQPTSPMSMQPVTPQPAVPAVPPSWAPTPLTTGQPHSEPDRATVVRPGVPRTLTVHLPDGRVVPLDGAIVVGRNPDPSLAPPNARPVAISDQSISKTHAAVELVGGRVSVTDLHSTNGTVIEVGGHSSTCEPGRRYPADVGSTIVVGDVRLRIGGGT